MAKIVIAGAADCPYYAKTELLADSLKKNLPDFKLHKIVKSPKDWETWLSDTCSSRGFLHKKSPIIWRELVDRGGKGLLIGGANEFQEYINGYYGLKSVLTSEDMKKMSSENLKTTEEIETEEKAFRELIKPVHVCITNANNPVCYHMMETLAKGEALGDKIDISIKLLDVEDNFETLEGLRMEVLDMAYPLLRKISMTSDPTEAFTDCSIIVLLDEIERIEKEKEEGAGGGDKNDNPEDIYSETKEDWLKRNHEHFVKYAQMINEHANQDVKVIIGGRGPVNFNTYMMLQHMPNVPRQNVVAMSRMMENHAKSVVAEQLKVNSSGVVDVVVWGHSYKKDFIDMTRARVHKYDGAIWGPPSFSLSVTQMIHDEKWLQGEFLELVKKRQQTIEGAVGHRASASHAAAVMSLIQHWWNGSPKGQIFSLGTQSEGWYGVPEGLVFSFPVTFNPAGYWTVVQDIDLSEESMVQIDIVIKDLVSEKEVIYPPPYVPPPTPPPEEESQTKQTDATDEDIPRDENGVAIESLSLGRITEDPEGEVQAATEVERKASDSKVPAEAGDEQPEVNEEVNEETPEQTDS